MGANARQRARLEERGLDGIFITVPADMLEDFKVMVEQKKLQAVASKRRSGRSQSRVSVSSEVSIAMQARLKAFRKKVKMEDEIEIPPPRPRGRPKGSGKKGKGNE